MPKRKSILNQTASLLSDICLDWMPSLYYLPVTAINMLICKVRDYGFGAHLDTSSGRDGQPHWLKMTNKKGDRIRNRLICVLVNVFIYEPGVCYCSTSFTFANRSSCFLYHNCIYLDTHSSTYCQYLRSKITK